MVTFLLNLTTDEADDARVGQVEPAKLRATLSSGSIHGRCRDESRLAILWVNYENLRNLAKQYMDPEIFKLVDITLLTSVYYAENFLCRAGRRERKSPVHAAVAARVLPTGSEAEQHGRATAVAPLPGRIRRSRSAAESPGRRTYTFHKMRTY